MKIKHGTFCPLIKKGCIQQKCKFFIKLIGKDPQTGNPIDEWDCAIFWLPILLVETSKEVRQNAAAVESFRNEMVRLNSQELTLLVEKHAPREN